MRTPFVLSMGLMCFGLVACQSNSEVKKQPTQKTTSQAITPQKTPEKTSDTQQPTTTKPAAVKDALLTFAPAQTYGGRARLAASNQVIRDQATYDAFVKHLPKNKVSKRRGVPSDDPLVKQPKIDFAKHALVVAVCASFYCKVNVNGYRLKGDAMTIVIETPPEPKENRMLQRPIGMNGGDVMGNYKALLVPTFKQKATFEIKR